MATRFRKSRKRRGSRTHGWGTSGQHRKGGMRGGHGKAGRFNHRWSAVIAGKMGSIGKKGFTPPSKKAPAPPAINLWQLDQMAEKLIAKGESMFEGEKPIIDLAQLGYGKLLGEGRVSHPLIVKVGKCSSQAISKIEEVGGRAVIVGE